MLRSQWIMWPRGVQNPGRNSADKKGVLDDRLQPTGIPEVDAVIDEMQRITGARLDNNGALLQQANRTWDAGSAVIDALARPAQGGPPVEGGDL